MTTDVRSALTCLGVRKCVPEIPMTANCISRRASGISCRVVGDSGFTTMNRATWAEPGSHHKTATRDRGTESGGLHRTMATGKWTLAALGRAQSGMTLRQESLVASQELPGLWLDC